MRKIFGSTALLALALALAVLPIRAQDTKPAQEKAERKAQVEAKPVMPPPGMRESILFQIDQAREKLVSLAEAMPAEKYGWRPGEGVRSVGEVFNHVSAANYFLPTFWGAKIPAGVDPRNLEKDGGDKAKTIDTLKKSFDSLKQEVQAVPEADLGRQIKLFGHDATVRDAMMVLASHAHEHLGQSIAYARMNGVVPPWSAAGQ
ncbi:MAG TPA: DinB family protein [Thermoanaerobaculia bacterium]